MNRDDAFEEWYDEYFVDTQGEDSPYSYDDVKIAFFSGWKWHKREAINSETPHNSRTIQSAKSKCKVKDCDIVANYRGYCLGHAYLAD